jgi:hypothetical protein
MDYETELPLFLESPLPEIQDTVSNPMEVDDYMDQPPSYEPPAQSPTPIQQEHRLSSSPAPMEVDHMEPAPSPESRRVVDEADLEEEGFLAENEEDLSSAGRSLAETFNKAVSMNSRGPHHEQDRRVSRRKKPSRKSQTEKRKKAEGSREPVIGKNEVIDLSLEEVSVRHTLFTKFF